MLSALAVVLGVVFVSGPSCSPTRWGARSTDLFSSVNKNIAVDVRGTEITPGSGNSDGGGRRDVPASTIATVQRVDGVAEVQGNVVNAQFNRVSVRRQGRQGAVHQRRADHRRQLDRLGQAQPAAGRRRHRAARPHRGRASTAGWPRRPA